MSDNREEVTEIAEELRTVVNNLAAELKLTRIAFGALRETMISMLDRDTCECSDGFTYERRKMN